MAASFAFEEYGVQDGSGFPYSNIFFIDTRKDTFLPGTPIRLRIDEENAGLAKVRAQTQAKAAPSSNVTILATNPGLMAAFNPVTETEAPAHRLSYRQYAVEPPVGGHFTLALKEIALPPSALCKDVTPQSIGFQPRLSKARMESRRIACFTSTRRFPRAANARPAIASAASMVSSAGRRASRCTSSLCRCLSFGFEGRDGRWIAVPVPVAP